MDDKRRVLFLINALSGGGAEHVFIHQANALRTRGVDVFFGTIFSSHTNADVAELLVIEPDRNISFDFKTLLDIRGLLRLQRFVRTHHIDVIYSTLNEANIIARFILLTLPWNRTRLIQREANVARIKPLKFKVFDILTGWRVNTIIAVSHQVQESLATYQPMYTSKIVELLNGVAIPDHAADVGGTGPEGAIHVLTIGSLTAQKGQQSLIQAISDVAKRGAHVILHIAGTGKLRDSLEELVASVGLKDRVVFHGFLHKQELAKLLYASQVFVQSSLWEGCPNALLEAMSYGLPCVATDVGATSEIITSEQQGILIKPEDQTAIADAVQDLIDNPQKRASLGLHARERMQSQFSMDQHLEKITNILLS